MTQKLSEQRNIGKTTAELLGEVGIHTLADLQAVGVVEAFRRLKQSFPAFVTLNALWGLEGVLTDMDWREIPPERKAELRAQVKDVQ